MHMAITVANELNAIGFGTLAGTAAEVRRKLGGAGEQVVAVTMDHADTNFAKEIEKAFQTMAPLIVAAIARGEQQNFEKIIDALVPQFPPPQHLLVEARMNAEARMHVFETADWLTAAQL